MIKLKMTVVLKHDNSKLVNECHNYNTRQRRNNNYFTQKARTKFG